MSRKSADEVSGDRGLQSRYSASTQSQMSASQRDALITRLWNEGVSAAVIGKQLGMTRRGVELAVQRIREGRTGRVRGE